MDSSIDRAAAQAVPRTPLKRVVWASALGTTVEYYDFTLYATTAALVFGDVFFPAETPLVGTLAAFATFFVGYLARPLGGLIFGHFGDRLGRKNVLIITMLMMGAGTFAIGLIPSYASIGITAPLLLVLIRLVQGLGMGGEYGGGVLMALEYSPKERQGLSTSLVHIGTPAGVLLPVGLVTLLDTFLPEGTYEAWAWRLPFLLSIALIGVGFYIRLRLSESPEFVKMRAEREVRTVPVKELFVRHSGSVVLSILAKIAESGLFNVYYVVAVAYVTTELDLPRGPVLLTVLIACLVECFTLPLFGALSDRVGRRRVYIAGAVFQAVLAVPFFLMVQTGDFALTTVAMVLGLAVGHGSMYGAQAALFANLYPVHVRYTGLSVTQQVGATLGGGLAPLAGTALLAAAGGHWTWLVAYMAGVAVISSLAASRLAHGEAPVPGGARRRGRTVGARGTGEGAR
ncbi:MFS family permease [Thermocatellispora tengchongensis]|uniref:Putative proline/betaine transporter n=1 Tax=Thermocatellispora tengchongensis TaxID=1073253 RepID=A0A840PDL1_9ACTN|nr:MFS transporter [Thermocatellispora tengchongensis]MBB5135247.1 MFS family permease [Thermocatellispora tengchongensis]